MESIDVLKKYKKRKTILNENIKFVITTRTKNYWQISVLTKTSRSSAKAMVS
jgi:hypothetical protein